VLVNATNGITVAAPGDVVVIRNLRFDGLVNQGGLSGIDGIDFQSGAELHLDHDVIFRLHHRRAPQHVWNLVTVDDSTFQDNAVGIENSSTGRIIVKNSTIEDNSTAGVESNGLMVVVNLWNATVTGPGSGLEASTSTGAAASNSGKLIIANCFFSSSHVDAERRLLGAPSSASPTAGSRRPNGSRRDNGGQIYSALNNSLLDNTTNGSFTGSFGMS